MLLRTKINFKTQEGDRLDYYQDAELDAMIDTARSSTDTEERRALYEQIQMYAIENALILPIWDNAWLTITADNVENLTFDLEGRPQFYNVWIGE